MLAVWRRFREPGRKGEVLHVDARLVHPCACVAIDLGHYRAARSVRSCVKNDG